MLTRDAQPIDFVSILKLNKQSENFLDSLSLERLVRLHNQAAYHRVVEINGNVAAFLLAFSESADYHYPTYLWFVEHFGKFIYIDRVVVSLSQQGRGIGKLLYEDLLSFAKANNTALITCEFDVVPPNEISRRFHERFGFKEVSTLLVGAYEKQVSLQALSVEMLN